MDITNILYDLASGTIGAVMGAMVMLSFGRKKNKQLSDETILARNRLEKIRLENDKLLGQIKNKEDKILAQEKKILNKKQG